MTPENSRKISALKRGGGPGHAESLLLCCCAPCPAWLCRPSDTGKCGARGGPRLRSQLSLWDTPHQVWILDFVREKNSRASHS